MLTSNKALGEGGQTLNGLRVFTVDGQSLRPLELRVFYSRRSDGPYYRWSYAPNVQQWEFVRVPHEQLPYLTLCASRWNNIPRALQSKLADHYVE